MEDNNYGDQLADINDLLDWGFITEECVIKTEKGDYRFKLKSLTPLEEADANQAVAARYGNKPDPTAEGIQKAIELLARSIISINGVDLDKVPQAIKGENSLQKRRYVVSQFSEKLMLPLWESYASLKERSSGEEDSPEEEEDTIKK